MDPHSALRKLPEEEGEEEGQRPAPDLPVCPPSGIRCLVGPEVPGHSAAPADQMPAPGREDEEAEEAEGSRHSVIPSRVGRHRLEDPEEPARSEMPAPAD